MFEGLTFFGISLEYILRLSEGLTVIAIIVIIISGISYFKLRE